MLGIVAALQTEARSLGSLPLTASGLVQLSPSTLLYIAGMGAKQAQVGAEVLIRENASALLSWGSAGALHSKLSPGNLILPKMVIYPPKGIFSTDDGWHNRLLTRLANQLEVFTEPLAQSTLGPKPDHTEEPGGKTRLCQAQPSPRSGYGKRFGG